MMRLVVLANCLRLHFEPEASDPIGSRELCLNPSAFVFVAPVPKAGEGFWCRFGAVVELGDQQLQLGRECRLLTEGTSIPALADRNTVIDGLHSSYICPYHPRRKALESLSI